MHALTEAALQYLAEGHHLLALHEKRPNTRFHSKPDPDSDEPGWSWERSIHGTVETDADREALDAIFGDPTTTGVAILIPQHMLVADIDTEAAALLYMQKAGALPQTRVAKTPNGLHAWFVSPGADQSVWLGGRTLLLKGFGGYVAAPPSAHFNAKGEQDGVYRWLNEEPSYDFLPDGIAEALADARAISSLAPLRSEDENSGAHIHNEWDSRGRLVAMWPEWNIEGLLKAVREAGEGNRNNMLAWAALTAAEEGCSLATVMSPLLDAALAAGLTRRESLTTIRAAFKRRHGG